MTREQTAAAAYAARGWPVFPVGPDKRPLTAHGFRDASCDAGRVRAWWSATPQAGIGWALPRGYCVLDVDARHRGIDSLAELQVVHGELPLTLSAQTGGGGLHLVFRVPRDAHVRQTAGELGAGLDTRVGTKGYIVLSPTLHQSGQRYRWLARVPIADAPAWLVRLLVPQPAAPSSRGPAPTVRIADRYSAFVLAGEATAVANTTEGGRNHRLYAAWVRCTRDEVARHLPREQVRETLTRAALAAGLGHAEIARTLRDEEAA